jgi:hypothetical protein
MKEERTTHSALTDSQLLCEVRRLVNREREATARLIAALAELDARRLYLAEGCSSLFTYCTQVLHLSEHAAYARIEAARAARKWPVVLDLIAEGSLHLTAVTLLSRHLTDENVDDLLSRARHKSKRDVEEIVAALRPLPAVPPTAASTRIEIKPLAPAHYRLHLTVTRETFDKIGEARDLLRHRIPNGDLAQIVDRALTLLLQDLHRAKHALVDRPRSESRGHSHGRHIPAAVKRAVWERDGGRCAFAGAAGRCTERGFLEYHHVVPFAEGGAASVDNLELRCRAHNVYESELWLEMQDEHSGP